MLRKQDQSLETEDGHTKSKDINASSIETETFNMSISSDKINGSINVFSAKISAPGTRRNC